MSLTLKKIYQHHISRGKKRRAVIGIIMHKLLRITYGILNNQKPFDANVDETNKSKTAVQLVKQISPKARRYQEINANAPISRSNYKKGEPNWSAKYQLKIYSRHHPNRLPFKNKNILNLNLEINGITSWTFV
jgi:hypothetical protein